MAITVNLSISLVILTVFITLSHGFAFAGDKDCDHKCVLSGNTYCGPIPCPYFPCDVPLEHTLGDCCEHCPTDKTVSKSGIVKRPTDPCPFPCTQDGQHYCFPPLCSQPPCSHPVTTPGDCCSHCPDDQVKRADPSCPFNCTQGGQRYCHHIPCPLPPCAKPVTTTGECCSHCPNGPSCTFKGVEIPVGQTVTVDSLSCHCKSGGMFGLIDCV